LKGGIAQNIQAGTQGILQSGLYGMRYGQPTTPTVPDYSGVENMETRQAPTNNLANYSMPNRPAPVPYIDPNMPRGASMGRFANPVGADIPSGMNYGSPRITPLRGF